MCYYKLQIFHIMAYFFSFSILPAPFLPSSLLSVLEPERWALHLEPHPASLTISVLSVFFIKNLNLFLYRYLFMHGSGDPKSLGRC